ncbi:unnamed protein product [Prorocentrum cordatum]|uniref:Uncharacterized protein n=1 Tax=Prorocentrum cordatum TaxID=2364126 RepID=A0ABN9Y4U1_9DINO|nr:unnamed protein product [Polarella glacialis]
MSRPEPSTTQQSEHETLILLSSYPDSQRKDSPGRPLPSRPPPLPFGAPPAVGAACVVFKTTASYCGSALLLALGLLGLCAPLACELQQRWDAREARLARDAGEAGAARPRGAAPTLLGARAGPAWRGEAPGAPGPGKAQAGAQPGVAV